MTVQRIIQDCGGATKVADASQKTANPVTFEAVFKWYRNGIPEVHWPLVIEMSGLTVEQIYNANRLAERQKELKSRKMLRRRSRPNKKRPEARAAAA